MKKTDSPRSHREHRDVKIFLFKGKAVRNIGDKDRLLKHSFRM